MPKIFTGNSLTQENNGHTNHPSKTTTGLTTMKHLLSLAISASIISLSAPAIAQEATSTSTSGSGAEANSGSVSGAQSDNNSRQAQQQNNAGIGNSESNSGSASFSDSASVSGAESNGNQQGQSQGQQSSLTNTNQLGQSAQQGNQQGVTVNQTWNTKNRKVQEVRTNAPVYLTASSSFSSDYCGGTASGGVSAAPIGISIGGAAPTFDRSCQYLRVAEKSGMLGANLHNAGYVEMGARAFMLEAWATCMAGPEADKRKKGYTENATMQACLALGLLGSSASPPSPPAQRAPEPAVSQDNGQPTPEAVERYKTPRGEATTSNSGPVALTSSQAERLAAISH